MVCLIFTLGVFLGNISGRFWLYADLHALGARHCVADRRPDLFIEVIVKNGCRAQQDRKQTIVTRRKLI